MIINECTWYDLLLVRQRKKVLQATPSKTKEEDKTIDSASTTTISTATVSKTKTKTKTKKAVSSTIVKEM